MGAMQPVSHEPSVALGELRAVLAQLDAGNVEGARVLLEGWQPVGAGEVPAFIGKGLPAYVDLLDRAVGLLGGFLRFVHTRDHDAKRVERVHRAFERFARAFSDAYPDELDELEQLDEPVEGDELEVRREAARRAAVELAPMRAALVRRHLVAVRAERAEVEVEVD